MKLNPSAADGFRIDATLTPYPSELRAHASAGQYGAEHGTTYGYVLRGEARVQAGRLAAALPEGGFFCAPGRFEVEHVSPGGLVVAITRHGFLGVPTFGEVEKLGRLSYIDGCSDAMLVYPPRLGDPVFNHLHFPAGVVQTQHTHPTIRLGIVARGRGHAYGPGWERELSPGAVFLLEPQEMHSFRTDKSGETMDVIAYHPDSDWGPTDTAHPMRNRTYIGANPFNTGG